MKSKFINLNSLTLYSESFGNSTDPAIILIMGATAQGVMWPNSFCEALSTQGFFVIRYDQRDTGKSSRIDWQLSPYYLDDLATDVIKIMDAYQIEDAHIIGASMGSFVAQILALKHHQRVKSLVNLMSSPNHMIFIDGFLGRPSRHTLPASKPLLLNYYQHIRNFSTSSADEADEMLRQTWLEISNGDDRLLETRMVEGKILKRLANAKYTHNHSYALARSKPLEDYLPKITAPTLIIHGADDYIIPVSHGKHLSGLIANSKFIEIPQMGHHFTKEFFPQFLEILKNFFNH
jgi:pimeloyl-ACP methyl ester carboxylesterase